MGGGRPVPRQTVFFVFSMVSLLFSLAQLGLFVFVVFPTLSPKPKIQFFSREGKKGQTRGGDGRLARCSGSNFLIEFLFKINQNGARSSQGLRKLFPYLISNQNQNGPESSQVLRKPFPY